MLSPPADSLTSDLPRTHFDGRPINRERPFLVGLGRVIRWPTNDSNWMESRTWTRCSAPKLTDDHFSNVIAPRSFGPKQCATQARTFLRSWPLPSNTRGAIISFRRKAATKVIVLFSTVTWPIPANPEDPRQLRPDMGSPAASGRASRANRAAPSTSRGTPAAPGS
jgi:hypothetical protein